MMRAFKVNAETADAGDNTNKKKIKTQYNYIKNAAANSCTQTNDFTIRSVTKNSKTVKKISQYGDYSILTDLNKAKTLPCGQHENKFDLSLCDLSFNTTTGLELGNDLNDILNLYNFDGTNKNVIQNYDFSGNDAGDISGVNLVDVSDTQFNDYFIDPCGILFNNNCESNNTHIGAIKSNMITIPALQNPLAEPAPNPYSNRYYKNRLNNVNLHSGVYFN